MATYNGGAVFLTPQLESIREQTIAEIDVWASDDGSTDDTSSILGILSRRTGQRVGFDIVRGPGQGFADNFRSLLARTDIDADYFAFSDQDEIPGGLTNSRPQLPGWRAVRPTARRSIVHARNS